LAQTKKALITGITGQELLLNKGYEVHGIMRRASTFNTSRIDHLFHDPHEHPPLHLHFGDLTDSGSLNKLIRTIKPDEIYNLGAQSHVRVSFDAPEYTFATVANGTLSLLEAIREADIPVKLYQASSSEQYGKVLATPQNETTPFNPQSPYAIAKTAAHQMAGLYREGYGMFACCGILFNHESPRRGETFVTRKITKGVAAIATGKQTKLYMGNLDAKRDWGFAGDYVEAMWLMLQQDKPDDYVVATGETHTVREFLEEAFRVVGLRWQDYVEIDPRYYRPLEVDLLLGDATKAQKKLGWKPKVTFKDLARMMVDSDLAAEGWLAEDNPRPLSQAAKNLK
jgi:GDPmannose 4,6-dehydratase